MNPLVRVVHTELLKGVVLEYLKTIDIQHFDGFSPKLSLRILVHLQVQVLHDP